MNLAIDKLVPNLGENRSRSGVYAAHLLRAVWIATGSALVIFLLFLALGRFSLSATGREFLFAFTYCALIAFPSIPLLTSIAHRYTERFPRLVVLMQAVALVGT